MAHGRLTERKQRTLHRPTDQESAWFEESDGLGLCNGRGKPSAVGEKGSSRRAMALSPQRPSHFAFVSSGPERSPDVCITTFSAIADEAYSA